MKYCNTTVSLPRSSSIRFAVWVPRDGFDNKNTVGETKTALFSSRKLRSYKEGNFSRLSRKCHLGVRKVFQLVPPPSELLLRAMTISNDGKSRSIPTSPITIGCPSKYFFAQTSRRLQEEKYAHPCF